MAWLGLSAWLFSLLDFFGCLFSFLSMFALFGRQWAGGCVCLASGMVRLPWLAGAHLLGRGDGEAVGFTYLACLACFLWLVWIV